MKIILTIIIFLLTWGSTDIDALTRVSDEIRLIDPVNGEIVEGNIDLNWYVKDQDQIKFVSTIDVFEKHCPNNGEYYGTITDNIINDLPLNGSNQQFRFNTYSSLQNKAGLSDGTYCLRVCGNFLEKNNYQYSMCETVSITVANYNKPPILISKPDKTNFKVGDTFSYQINATDPDQNPLSYKMISAPDFIIINNQTGLITSQGKLTSKGSFVIKYRVEDIKGAYVEDVFTINVTEETVLEDPIILLMPVKGDNYKDENLINIEWKVTNSKKIKQFIISYATDINQWTEIKTINQDTLKYVWDITNQDSGNYYLKIEFEFEDGSKYALNSDMFSIDRSGGDVPFLRILNPEEDQIITDNNIVEVLLEARGANSAKIGQIKFNIDDIDYTERCQMQTDNSDIISCLSTELENGKHKINFLVKDFNDKQNLIEWYFEIDYEIEISPTPINTDNNNSDAINLDNLDWQSILIYVCSGGGVLIVIIIIVWLLKKLLGKKSYNEDSINFTQTGENVTTYDIIGNQTLQNSPPAMPNYNNDFSVPVYQPPTENNQPQELFSDTFNNNVEMPTMYQSNDIPDWLKDVDASKPVGLGGQDMNNAQTTLNRRDDALDDAARPHE